MKEWREITTLVPDRSGVYSVWVGEKILYIGFSKNMRRRLRSHNKLKEFILMGVTGVKWLVVNYGIFNEWAESVLIYRHRPVLCANSRWGVPDRLHCHESWAKDKILDWMGITIRYDLIPQDIETK